MNDPIDIAALVEPCDLLLVVPPFSPLDRAGLGVHVLQACARKAGFKVSVLYANLLFARHIGEHTYRSILMVPHSWLLGERLFARYAYDTPPLGHDRGSNVMAEYHKLLGRAAERDASRPAFLRLQHEGLLELERQAGVWLDSLIPALADIAPPIVGTTTTFEQTAPGLALLRRLATRRPEVTRIIGGANCEGEMAQGIQAIAPYLDHVFSGECESALVDFLQAYARGERPQQTIIRGQPCMRMDDIPTPDYREYYHQLKVLLPESTTLQKQTCIPYETSRGCWWGQKSHCTFCGLNGEGMGYREKSPERVIEDLRVMATRYPSTVVFMTDNIMPHRYYRSVLPRIRDELPSLGVFYELKSNLTLRHVRALAEAGVRQVQPGIESLSTGLLRLMAKGVSAAQNIAALRYFRVFDMSVRWNVMYRFPGDSLSFYRESLELMPLLRHLHPPSGGATPVTINRFSPYQARPQAYGISNLRATSAYWDVLPLGAPVDKVAYDFDGDFPTAMEKDNETILAIERMIDAWNDAWSGPASQRPILRVERLGGRYELTDTRGLNPGPTVESISAQQAEIALTGRLPASADASIHTWALARKVVVECDGSLLPLAVADYDLLDEMEQHRPPAHTRTRLSTPAPALAS